MEIIKNKTILRRYSKYKYSGIDWLGNIPEHWKLIRGNYVFQIVDERSKKGEEELLSVSEIHGVKPRSSTTVNMFKAEDYSGYKLCYPGDLVINSLWAWSRGLGISDYFGIVSTAYSVFRPDYNRYNKQFLNYLLRNERYVAKYNMESKGIWKSRLQISDWSFLRIPILIPPKPEQTRIANFLDRKCEQIDKAIAQKERLIELLKERRQIIIQNAVTRGLDPNVKLKDSGVEWIGKIPEHWEVVKLKRLFTFFNNRRIPLSVDEREKRQGKYPYYGASGIIDYIDDYIFDENLIIIAEDGANLLYKSTPLAFVAKGKYWVNNHAHILKPNFSGFIFWSELLCSIDYATKISGAAQPKLSKERLANIFLPLPSKEELIKLSDYFADVDNKFKQAITYQQNQIEKLKEYKSVLIDSAVTGKIKVNE